jgi:hypothetical protein
VTPLAVAATTPSSRRVIRTPETYHPPLARLPPVLRWSIVAARVRSVVCVGIGALVLGACGLDFNRFEPGGDASAEGGGGSSGGTSAEGSTLDAAKDGAVDGTTGADSSGIDASKDAPGVDAVPETGPTGCTPSATALGVPVAPGAITIDGDLTDWGNQPVTVLAANDAALILGPNGTCTAANATSQCMVPPGETAEVLLLRDTGNLYVAVRVTVPTIGGNSNANPYLNDAVELYLRGDPVATGNYTNVDHQYVVDWQNHVLDYGPSPSDTGQPNPPGFTSAVKVAISNKAYVVETKIALAQLGQTTFAAGQAVGFDLGLDHGQGNVQTRSLLVWMMASHAAPTCTNAKCTGCSPDYPYCDTLLFGTACSE